MLDRKKGFLWPKKRQWFCFFQVLNKKEKTLFFVFTFLLIASALFLLLNFYFTNTEKVPAIGGQYREGVVGQPRFINPIYATSDVDRGLVELVYSGLMKHNTKGEIVFDLAESYEKKEDGKVYAVELKQDAFWHDREPLTADDVVFTIESVQKMEYKSPFRANWLGIKVEKVDDFKVRFILEEPYAGFLENLTFKILPEHIWSEISVANFPLSSYNFKPIGSGPYQIKEIEQEQDRISSLSLERFKNAYISEIEFVFFQDQESISKVDGLGSFPALSNNWQTYNIAMPRYFALFFNLDKLDNKEIRQALNCAIDKKEFEGKAINSPFLPEFYGLASLENDCFDLEKAEQIFQEQEFEKNPDTGYWAKAKEEEFSFTQNLQTGSRGEEVEKLQECLIKENVYSEEEVTGYFGPKTKQAVIAFQEKYSQEILEPSGLNQGTGAVRGYTKEKLNQVCLERESIPFTFTISTLEEKKLLKDAEILKEQLEKVGVKVIVEKITEKEIKERQYESLLIGVVLNTVVDPLPFWHSEQKKDPGFNLSLYENKKADEILEKINTIHEPELRKEKLEQLQEIITADLPASFLYTRGYTYSLDKKIKGIELEKIIKPAYRFSQIQDWYIKTQRTWK